MRSKILKFKVLHFKFAYESFYGLLHIGINRYHHIYNHKVTMAWSKGIECARHEVVGFRACLVRKNFQDSSSHRIFGRMHEALNIDENKTNCTVYL